VAVTPFTPVTVYGPHDRFDGERGHVIGALFARLAEAEAGSPGQALVVWGSGEAVRQYVYVADVPRAIRSLLDLASAPHVILAADDGISVRELALAVAQAMEFPGPIRFDPSRPEGLRT